MRKKNKTSVLGVRSADILTDKDIVSDPERESQQLLESVKDMEPELQELYNKMVQSDTPSELEEEVQVRLRSMKRTSENIINAYYHAGSMKDELNARWKDVNRGVPRRFIPAAPANAWIDLEEHRSNHFAQGMNIYKLMLVGFIGSFAGVVIEMLWCLLSRGYIESRAGVVYGPFNLLYGAGAVFLSVTLYKFRNKGRWISFFGGLIVGSLLEYVCSWGQELLLGSRSWDYSNMPFNINGRICLLYSVFWGFLGAAWIKGIYPWMAKLILKIPNRVGKVLAWMLAIFLVVNEVITLIALFRWSQRIELVEPANAFWAFIDSRFPNERMEWVFANMEFGTVN